MRAAFATKDGKFISQHFGHTPSFCIVEIDEESDTWQVIEKRDWVPICHNGNHDSAALKESVRSLSDCGVLFAVKVGPYAKQVLERYGIQVLEITGFIDEVIEGYIAFLNRRREMTKRRETTI